MPKDVGYSSKGTAPRKRKSLRDLQIHNSSSSRKKALEGLRLALGQTGKK